MKKVLVHIPHSSTVIPAQYKPCFLISPLEIERELLNMTDRYADELAPWPDRLVFPVSRLVCDVERFRDKKMESMAPRGMWACYTHTSDGKQMKNTSPDHENEVLSLHYDPHQERLLQMAQERILAHGCCVIVDVHSYPEKPLPYEQSEGADRPDICIGTDGYHTPDGLKHMTAGFFDHQGYSTAFDHPFSGAITPAKMYRREPRLKSVMIEIKRNIYMDEKTGEKTAGFLKLKACIGEYLALLEDLQTL